MNLIFTMMILMVYGCSEEVHSNRRPVAFAGFDQMIAPGEIALLDGSASFDPDGDAITFHWSLHHSPGTESQPIDIDKLAIGPRLQLELDTKGIYIFNLVVDDGTMDSVPDQVNVVVGDSVTQGKTVPIAQSSSNTWALIGTPVSFNAGIVAGITSSARILWNIYHVPLLSKIVQADLQITGKGNSVSFIPDVTGYYTLAAQVVDTDTVGPPDFVSVQVLNEQPDIAPPLASAQADPILADKGDRVVLSASNSLGAGGDTHELDAFEWNLALGPQSMVETLVGKRVEFVPKESGLYVWGLYVKSAGQVSAPDLVAVRVR
ncbi:MAG: hypothetical protein GXP49_16230 [Deltaproteobacteria bacterium]|nr:hypothetical protein [Deltaproteobacteria bacterium]